MVPPVECDRGTARNGIRAAIEIRVACGVAEIPRFHSKPTFLSDLQRQNGE